MSLVKINTKIQGLGIKRPMNYFRPLEQNPLNFDLKGKASKILRKLQIWNQRFKPIIFLWNLPGHILNQIMLVKTTGNGQLVKLSGKDDI